MVEDREETVEEIRMRLAEVKRMREQGQLQKRDTKGRRAAEQRQRKDRVNSNLLRGQGLNRDDTWTIRARADLVKRVKALAERLSEPRAKVSIAALMEEAMELLLQKHEGGDHAVEA